jgi:hypothetical protein
MREEIPQQLKSFLEDLEKEESPGRWGFTLYSTYPAFSSVNETFDKKVCDKFQAYMESYIRFNIEEPYGVKVPLDIEYIRLPSASIPEARRHFRAKYGWPEKHKTSILRTHLHWGMRYNVFIAIDEETMKGFLDAPEAISEMPVGMSYEDATKKEDEFVVKVVDVDYDEACEGIVFSTSSRRAPKDSPYSITFHGYLKTTLRWLYEVWYELMLFNIQKIFKHKDEVFKGVW